MEQEVKTLNKLLNHKIFLDEFPEIKGVAVNEYGRGIDVVFFLNSGLEYRDYESIRSKAKSLVYRLSQMAGISPTLLSIYP